MKGSGFAEIVIEAGICASGSLENVMSGKHYNRALRVHRYVLEGLQRLLMQRFDEVHQQSEADYDEAILHILACNPSHENLELVLASEKCCEYFDKYLEFLNSIRNGESGNTAQLWVQYMDCISNTYTDQSHKGKQSRFTHSSIV